MHWESEKFMWLTFLQRLLYRNGLELNLWYLWGLPGQWFFKQSIRFVSPCLELLMYLKADPLCFANVNFSKRSFQFVSFLYSEAFWSTQVKCSQPADIYWVWNAGYLCYRFKGRYDTVFFSWAPNLEAKRSWGQDESPDNKAATF